MFMFQDFAHRFASAVYGVKDSLIVEFVLHELAEEAEKYGRPILFYTADYDFVLVPGQTRRACLSVNLGV
jgi:hypothetical protein